MFWQSLTPLYPLLAHLDRVSDSESGGGGFESRRVGQLLNIFKIGIDLILSENFNHNNFKHKTVTVLQFNTGNEAEIIRQFLNLFK